MARPRTLWWSLTLELWRMLLLTAAVIVAVVVFALAVRPLADGRLEAADALRFMLYATVPMLQYALPFAGGFAATLVYHRLASDNELTGVYAGGVSHRAALVPALGTGLALAAALLVLADQVMPRFLHTMQRMITRDATRLIVSSIEKGQSVKMGRRQVFADQVQALGSDPATGAFERLVLTGVLAVETGEDGGVVREASARAAMVWLHRGVLGAPAPPPDTRPRATDPVAPVLGRDVAATTIVLQLRDSIGRSAGVGLSEVEESTFVYVIGSGFGDHPRYHSWSALEIMKRRPELHDDVDLHRRALAAAIAERELAERIARGLERDGAVEFRDTADRRVVLRAGGLGGFDATRGWEVLPRAAGALVEVETTSAGAAGGVGAGGAGGAGARVQRARRAWLAAPVSPGEAAAGVAIELEEVAGLGAPSAGDDPTPVSGHLSRWAYSRLRPAADPLPDLLSLSVRGMLDRAAPRAGRGPEGRVPEARAALERRLTLLLREIASKQHERVAYAAACGVMVLCGGVVAMRLGQALPLTVYLWSFLPALVGVLTIVGGQRAAHVNGWWGFPVLWAGVVALGLFTLWEYRRLARH